MKSTTKLWGIGETSGRYLHLYRVTYKVRKRLHVRPWLNRFSVGIFASAFVGPYLLSFSLFYTRQEALEEYTRRQVDRFLERQELRAKYGGIFGKRD